MNFKQHIKLALAEDQYQKDITTKLIKPRIKCKAIVKAKESFHIYGLNWFKEVFKTVDINTDVKFMIKDGDMIKKGKVIAEIKGINYSLLKAERVALNYLQTMSGTYDLCIKYKNKLKNKKIKLLHTRKTIPLFRLPLSESCSAAGCLPHRNDLSSSVLFKENHLKFLSDPIAIIKKAIKMHKTVVVEAKTLRFAKSLVDLKIDRILLDNFTPTMLKNFLKFKSRMKIEISGSINLNNIHNFSQKGVNFISIGALTKNIYSKDISMIIV